MLWLTWRHAMPQILVWLCLKVSLYVISCKYFANTKVCFRFQFQYFPSDRYRRQIRALQNNVIRLSLLLPRSFLLDDQ